MISALLTQKPDSPEPVAGEVKSFSLEQKPKKKNPDETWTKAKNESGDFGDPYKIVKAERLGDYTHPQHGTFHQFSILLEPAVNGDAPAQRPEQTRHPVGEDERSAKIDRAVAFKAAVSFLCRRDLDRKADPKQIAELTDELLGVLTGGEDTGSADPNPQPDDGIPF